MLAPRAGSDVVTCEINKVAAAMARELAERNGLADRIRVLDGNSRDVRLGEGLPRRANLLLCDIFGDELLDFDPLPLIADARERLLAPGAASVPEAVGLRVALACWEDYGRIGQIDAAASFELSGFADFVPAAIRRPIGEAGLRLLSADAEAFRFDLGDPPRATLERRGCVLEAGESGTINTLARWIRLKLGGGQILEARPEPGGTFFSGLTLAPLGAEITVAAGEIVQAGALRNGRSIDTWLELPSR
jgi:protein arginine N-methyltransferase 7